MCALEFYDLKRKYSLETCSLSIPRALQVLSVDAPWEDGRELEILMVVIKGYGLQTIKKQRVVGGPLEANCQGAGLSWWQEEAYT